MRKILRKLLPITFTLAVATAVTFSTPVFVERAYAAPMEDCDLDGYDDHTGKPVPWRGFDGTKGDEVPSDWDGVSDSYVFKNNKSDSSKSNSSSSLSSSSSSKSSSGSSSSSSSGPSSTKKTTTKSSSKSKSTKSSSKSSSKSTKKESSKDSSKEETTTKVEETTTATEETTTAKNKKKSKKKSKEQVETTVEQTTAVEETTVPEQVEEQLAEEETTVQETEQKTKDIADTFLKAATVGFTTENKGLIPGIIILVALAGLGVLTLAFGSTFNKKK